MTIKQLLKEEIYGNTATVYHRCTKDKLKLIIERTYQNQSHIHFDNYNQALYTTYNMKSQMGKSDAQQKTGDMSHYGDYVIKFAVKGLQNFFFTNENEYKKFHPNFKGTDFLEQQLKDAGAGARVLNDFNNIPKTKKNHVVIGKFLEKERYIPSRFKGLQYNGQHDGDCLLIFDYTSVIPLSITNDDGKTWIKVQDFIKDQNIQKVDDFKKNKFKNFQKNDSVNKTKQSRKLIPFHIDGKDLNIDYDIENAAEFKKYNFQKDFNNLIINSQVRKIYLSDMNFKKATINNVDFVFKKCNFDTFILGKTDTNNNLIDGEIEVLEYKLNTIDSLYYFLDNNYTTLKVKNLTINAKCFNFQASELEDDDGSTMSVYAAGDFSDLFRMIKLQKIIIDGKKLNKKVFEKCLRGTKIKAYYGSKVLEVRDGKLIEKDDVSYLMVDEKIFNY